MLELLFKGKVQVYLEGKNALLPYETFNRKNISYFVGSKRSLLTIRDFRYKQMQVAHHILSGKNGFEFADIFNEPAFVKVYSNDEKNTLEVEMHETENASLNEVLWLGVVDNNNMTAHEIEWEVLRPISKRRTAFIALVKQEN